MASLYLYDTSMDQRVLLRCGKEALDLDQITSAIDARGVCYTCPDPASVDWTRT
jgi:hypothetical protein